MYQLEGLKCRVGIEAMVLITRNNHEFNMAPSWLFTSPQIERYLVTMIKGFDTERIGGMMEAFAIAGCDVLSE